MTLTKEVRAMLEEAASRTGGFMLLPVNVEHILDDLDAAAAEIAKARIEMLTARRERDEALERYRSALRMVDFANTAHEDLTRQIEAAKEKE